MIERSIYYYYIIVFMDKIVSLAKRRGFVYQSSLIYGGLSGFWDYGPMGALLKRNIEEVWFNKFVYERDNIYLIDTPIIYNPKVWEASGHVEGFNDLMVECIKCHKRFKKENVKDKCPDCSGTFADAKQFNLMLKTNVGVVDKQATEAYLRPETAQGIFINFKNILDTFSPKFPFGVAQIGKAYRNEITYGDFIFRMREFTQMELEYFVEEGTDQKHFDFWVEESYKFFQDLGLKTENLKLHEHKKQDLSHYSKQTIDVQYNFPFGLSEIQGTANRGDFDLRAHSVHSGVDFKHYPFIIEPSFGLDRAFLALMCDSYTEEKLENGKERIVMKFAYNIAPYKAAVFPLVANKPDIVEKAKNVYNLLKKSLGLVNFDDNDNIGKRYRRQDEIGTPYCVTIDYQSLEDNTVTIRNRDTMKQDRVNISKMVEYIYGRDIEK